MAIFLILFSIIGNIVLFSGEMFPGGEMEGNAIAIIVAILTIVADGWIIFKIGQEISAKNENNKFKKILPKIISIFLICAICVWCIYKMLPKCDLCNNISTKSVDDYKLCDSCYNSIEQDVENCESGDHTVPVSDYRKTVGMNGTIRYYCTRNCGEGCVQDGRNCTRGYSDSKCKFEYSLSGDCFDSGWSGCPCCDSITYEEWYDWYERALERRY